MVRNCEVRYLKDEKVSFESLTEHQSEQRKPVSYTSRPIVCFFSVFLIARGGNGPEDRTREIEVKLIFRSLLLLLNAAYARKLIQSELRYFWRRGDISSATVQ